MIVRRNHNQTALGGKAASQRFAILELAVVDDHLAAVAFGRVALDRGRVGRHEDDARNVEQVPRERDRLRVIAGRKGQHPTAPLGGGEARQRIEGAAKLEGAGALEVFALEEQVRVGPGIERPRGDDRRAMRDAEDLPGGVLNILERRA